MNYGKTIKIFLPSGKTDEVKIASIANSTVQATLIPRNILSEIDNYQEISSTGIYFLLDNDYNIYVGEAEIVTDRIKQHNKDERKDWWNTVIAINVNSLNSPLSKGDIKYLEGFAYNEINEAGKFILDQTVPAKASVSRDREADLMHIFEDIKVLVSTLNYPIFEPIRKIFSNIQQNNDTTTNNTIFYLNRKRKNGVNVRASGEYNDKGFLVYSGAIGCSEITGNFSNPDRKIKDYKEFLEKSLIKENEDNSFITLKDIQFNSPSAAAEALIGVTVNGLSSWKTSDGTKLRDFINKDNS
jgi:hypothetical protein